MSFMIRFLSRRLIIILIMIILALSVGGLWYIGNQILKTKQAQEEAENSKILAEYNRIQALVKQKEATGEEFERFSTDSLGKDYTTKDLLVNTTENPTTIKAYGLMIRQALLPIATQSPDPVRLTLDAFDNQDKEALKNLQMQAAKYQEATRNLAAVSVPKSAMVAHLRLINNLRQSAAILGAMSEVETEPIKAFEASSVFHTRIQGVVASLFYLNNFFLEQEIIFSPSEQIISPIFTP